MSMLFYREGFLIKTAVSFEALHGTALCLFSGWMTCSSEGEVPLSFQNCAHGRLWYAGLFEEIETLAGQGVSVDASRLKVSDRAHLLFDLHKQLDGLREDELAGKQIGTTKRGIGPAYSSKACTHNLAPLSLLLQSSQGIVLVAGHSPGCVAHATG